MDTMFASAGLLVLMCLILLGFSQCFSFVCYPKARKEFKKLKKEIIDGTATAYYQSSYPACHTKCKFRYSSGKFEIHLDPVSSPFGSYDYKNSTVALKPSDMGWLARKAHLYAQKNNLEQLGIDWGLS